MRGADTVVRDLIRAAAGKVYNRYFADEDTQQIECGSTWADQSSFEDHQPAAESLKELREIQGLIDKLVAVGVKTTDPAPKVVAAAEFLLEGLVAHRKLSRNEDRGFSAPENASRKERRIWRSNTRIGSAAAEAPAAAVDSTSGCAAPG